MNKNNRAQEHHSAKINDLLKESSQKEQDRVDKRMLLAAKIDSALKARGWNQSRFSKEMKKRPSEISKWLSGTHNFTTDTLWDIEEKLGIHIIIVSENRPNVTRVARFETVVASEFKPHAMAGFKNRTYLAADNDQQAKKRSGNKSTSYA